MNTEDKTFQVSEIISRYILGNISDAEKEQLERWLAESPRHKDLFDKLIREEITSGKVRAYERINWQEARKNLLERKKSESRMRQRRRVIRWTRYAAVIVLFVGLYVYFRSNDKLPEINKTQVTARVIPAGKPTATLQLASGEEILLTSDRSCNIKQENGVIIKQDSGIIKYRVDGTKVKQKEQFNTITVPRGGEFSLMLSDGTRVWLNAETRLRYPVEFVGDKRKVYLEGEAFFDVSHDKQKQFVVETEEARVKVFGTAFNVYAYKDDDATVATLVRGSIELKVRDSDDKVRLEPGEQGTLINGKLTKQDVDVEMYTAWREGRMVFKSIRLEDLLHHMARWYNVDVVFSREELKDVTFTGEAKKYEDFSEVLDIIETTQSVRFRVEDRTIIVY